MSEHAVIQAAALQALDSDPLESLQIDTRLVNEGMIGQVTESVGKWTTSLQSWIDQPSTGKLPLQPLYPSSLGRSVPAKSELLSSFLFLLSFFLSFFLLLFRTPCEWRDAKL